MKLRTLLFWPHLIAGVGAGAVILVMSVTGVVLTYERQLIEWSNSDYRSVPPAPGAPRLPVEDLLAAYSQSGGGPVANVAVGAEVTDPVILTAGPRTVYLDAYSGRLLGEGRQGMRQFMSDVRAWHRWLAYEGEGRTTARAITGWSNVAFLFIVVSGLYLWFPRRWTWKHMRPVVVFTKGASGKARDFNWHNVIGAWCLVPLFIVVISAVPISFPWGNDLVYRAMGEEPPARRGGGPGEQGRGEGRGARGRGDWPARQARQTLAGAAGLNGLLTRAAQQESEWQTISVRIPDSPRAPLVFAIDRGDGGQPQLRSTLTLDRTGSVVTYETFASQTPGRRMRSIMRFAHTGEVLGLTGQTIAGIATAGSVVLVWTGIALALRRGRAWLVRRRLRASIPIAEDPAA
ncbi:MAG TPA: PepSY-associated TM helix domain-containing protein [Vicinamibacterales bacterium]|nr:PepSY-associated TM helix domain-containing protein [Vicinamibacterales bacterium]